MRAIRIAGAGTVLALGAFIVVMVRREKGAPGRRANRESPITNPDSRIPNPVLRQAQDAQIPSPYDHARSLDREQAARAGVLVHEGAR
jgi:hypothetical protein